MNTEKTVIEIIRKGAMNTRVKFSDGSIELVPNTSLNSGDNSIKKVEPARQIFSVEDRLRFMEQQITMVATGMSASLFVMGPGGLSKTHTVLQTLNNLGIDYSIMKGYTTPKAMFDFLKENNGKTIVFDDCDDAFKDIKGKNLIKAVTDSYAKRIVSWNTTREDSPSFEFTGQIIFITNVPPSSIDGAIISRALVSDLSMTSKERLDLLTIVAPQMDNPDMADRALKFVKKNADRINSINIRSLIKVMKCFEFTDDEQLALYQLMSTPEDN